VCEWRGDGPLSLDESPVVAGEAEEATKRANGARAHLVGDRLDLLGIHRHAIGRHHMSEVRHGRHAERALGSLEPELMLAECVEDEVYMAQMLGPGGAVD
jgi:hypothetical protein